MANDPQHQSTPPPPAWLAALADHLDRLGHGSATQAEVAECHAAGLTAAQAAAQIAACREADTAACP